jgi:hypothetical protein
VYRASHKKRLSRVQIIALAIAAGVVFGGGTAWAVTTVGEPADCIGGVPTVDDNGLTHLDVNCTFAAPVVTVTTPVPVPGPTVTVEVPGPTVYVTLPASTTTITVTPSPTRPPVTTPPATTPPPTTPPATSWPGAANTGVPAGVVLTAYTGPCTVTVANTVIDSKDIRCAQFVIRANGVAVRNSRITGTGPQGLATVDVSSTGVTFTDVDVLVVTNSSGIDGSGYIATRVDISGGNRGAWCSNCTIRDSYIHGGRATGSYHASGLRADQFSTFVHNAIVCDIPGDYCSADLTGYPDFQPTRDWTITNNYFGPASGSWFCAYGGNTQGKPHSGDAVNATNIKFVGNVFARGLKGTCAAPMQNGVRVAGTPITDFAKNRTGNIWSENRYEDGVLIP